MYYVSGVHAMAHKHSEKDIDLECLSYAVAEIEALAAAYGDGLQLAPLELAHFEQACALCGLNSASVFLAGQEHKQGTMWVDDEASDTGTHEGTLGDLSGTCVVPEVKLFGHHISLRFQLPPLYPLHAAAKLSVVCCAPRAVHDQLHLVVTSCADQALGGCCLLTAMQDLQHAAEEAAAAALKACAKPDSSATAAAKQPTASVSRQLIWFHHIKSLKKRKTIMEQAEKLRLGGGCKPGFPGVVVIEGLTDDVEEFTQQIRSLSWQAMQVRGRATQALQSSGGSHASLVDALAASRQLPDHFVEFQESGMSDLAAMCKLAGLESLFATALKL